MIRPAEEKDLPRIAKIHSDAWHHAYPNIVSPDILATVTPESRLNAWRQWFAVDSYNISVYVEQNQPVGFTLTCPARDIQRPPRNYGELTHLYIDPSRISTGIGHHLFCDAVAQIKSGNYAGMLLWTLEGNTVARRFYESHNMLFDGARQDEPDWLGPGVYEVRYVYPFDNIEP